jgi:hypothetical protein
MNLYNTMITFDGRLMVFFTTNYAKKIMIIFYDFFSGKKK